MFCIVLFLFLTSCQEKDESKLFVISGKLIDGTNKKDFTGFKLKVRSIVGSSEKHLGEGEVDSSGNFKISYYFETEKFGNNLRINVTPTILTQEKFEFLPLGENWYREFYVGDSSTLFIKLSEEINKNDTLFLYTPDKNYIFFGPLNKNLGKVRLINSRSEIYYKKNKSSLKIYRAIPTGDPIVDTITLNINP